MHEVEVNRPRRWDSRGLKVSGLSALAIVLYCLLAEAAIETFVGRSPARWWVAVTVGVYLAGSAALWWRRHPLWSRLDPATRAGFTFFVFLSLLAFTAWLPGGLTHGLRLLGLTTSTVLHLTTAVAVGCSGWILMRARYPHPAIKWAVGVLAVYGVAAYGWAIVAGTSYPELLHGQSFWSRLPRWLQGAFVGVFLAVPLATVLQTVRTLGRLRQAGTRGLLPAGALALSLVIAASGITSSGGTGAAAVPISDRGPGMRRQALSLRLPVPATFEMTHVAAAHFADALGKDPTKIFEFVRDQIAYEAYTGSLRGPRGTLQAMAGNSVDRAALLAALFQEAGYRVRYARGTLPEREATELVTSMWAERPQPPRLTDGSNRPPSLNAVLATFDNAVRRDHKLIRDQLKKKGTPLGHGATPSLSALAEEARSHYWAQWLRDGAWVDLDPSFGDAIPGRTYARAEETPDALPESLFHRVEIRVGLEEYTGDQISRRIILSYAAKAADLSGADLILTHQPENWKGPAKSIQRAIASAVETTGRVKPVLIIGEKEWVAGEPFRPKPPTGRGIGGVRNVLQGAGGRTDVPIATAESIEFHFIAPSGHKERVTRELFDIVGAARRAAGRNLSKDEVRERTESGTAIDIAQSVYSILLTTGRMDPGHLSAVASAAPQGKSKSVNLRAMMRRVHVAFIAASDGILARLGAPDRAVILFYPDTPRIQILEISTVGEKRRMVLDLRHDSARAVAIGPHPEDAFFAQVFRGVINGTLERMLIGYIVSGTADQELPWKPGVSTSRVFEQAVAEGVPAVLLTRDNSTWDGSAPDDIRARIRQDIADGYWLVIPRRGISLDRETRYAWWRVHATSGATTAVADDGLHAAAVEWGLTHEQTDQGERYIVTIYVAGTPVSFEVSATALASFVEEAMRSGWNLRWVVRIGI